MSDCVLNTLLLNVFIIKLMDFTGSLYEHQISELIEIAHGIIDSLWDTLYEFKKRFAWLTKYRKPKVILT